MATWYRSWLENYLETLPAMGWAFSMRKAKKKSSTSIKSTKRLTNQVMKDSELFSLLFMERTHGSELSRWNVPQAELNREVAATGSGQGLRNKDMVYTEQETSPLGLVLSDSESSTFRGSIIIQGNDWPKQEGIRLKIVRKQLFHLWWNLCAELYIWEGWCIPAFCRLPHCRISKSGRDIDRSMGWTHLSDSSLDERMVLENPVYFGCRQIFTCQHDPRFNMI